MLDASVAAGWAFDDEEHPVAAETPDRIRTDQACAPAIWWFHIRNILAVNQRRGRLTAVDLAMFLRGLARLGVAIYRRTKRMSSCWPACTD